MYRLREETSGGLKKVILEDPGTGVHLSVVPAFGANVNELVLVKNGKPYSVLSGNKDAGGFEGKGVFRSAKLSPFPNRLKDGTYTFEGKEYRLELNYPEEHNACHGFIYNKVFFLEKHTETEDSASVTFAHNYDGSLAGYPFNYKISLDYALSASDGFECTTTVKNTGKASMPVGDGWHPFFTFNKDVAGLELAFSAEEKIEVDDRLMPTGKKDHYRIFDTLKKIGNTCFDTCFKLMPGSTGCQTTELHDRESGVTIRLWQETGVGKYNYLQIFIPSERTSIAIEPTTCDINAFNNHEGIIVLKPGENFRGRYGVKLA